MAADGHSGLIGMDGHLSGHGASFGQSMVPASPHSSSKRLSGNLMPEGSYEQSLFAQGHSTNAGSTGNHSGMPSTSVFRLLIHAPVLLLYILHHLVQFKRVPLHLCRKATRHCQWFRPRAVLHAVLLPLPPNLQTTVSKQASKSRLRSKATTNSLSWQHSKCCYTPQHTLAKCRWSIPKENTSLQAHLRPPEGVSNR